MHVAASRPARRAGSPSARAVRAARSSSPKTSAFDRASPTGVDRRACPSRRLQRAVAARDVVALEERRGRQHHVGVARGVGHHLVEDDGEEIVALEPAQHAPLVGRRDRRVAVVDEQHLDRRIGVLGQRAAELVHVDDARRGLRRADPGAVDAPRRRVAHRVAAAAHAELAADGRQREDGQRRRCRRCGCAPAPTRSGSAPGARRRTARRPRASASAGTPASAAARSNVHGSRALAQLVAAPLVWRVEERVGRRGLLRTGTGESRARRQVGARPHGQVEVGLLRERASCADR